MAVKLTFLRVSVATRATLLAAQKALRRELAAIKRLREAGKCIGIGVACGFKNVEAGKGKIDDAGAIFSLLPDGRVLLRGSAVDMGQGIRTTLVQVAVEVLGINQDLFEIITGDTALTIRHGGAVGERQTLISGKAVELAAREFRDAILQKAAVSTKTLLQELSLKGKHVIDGNGTPLISLADLAAGLHASGKKLEVRHY